MGPELMEEVRMSFISKAQCLGAVTQGRRESVVQAPGTAHAEGGKLNWPECVSKWQGAGCDCSAAEWQIATLRR